MSIRGELVIGWVNKLASEPDREFLDPFLGVGAKVQCLAGANGRDFEAETDGGASELIEHAIWHGGDERFVGAVEERVGLENEAAGGVAVNERETQVLHLNIRAAHQCLVDGIGEVETEK
jgi:hypothetical protein